MRRQALKDYVLFPALSGPLFAFPLAGNATANLARNLWAFTIIFCGHFPEGTHEFSEEETEDETRGQWYYRQLLGSANLSGGPLFHILAGNLSFQIEHHLFPDLPGQPLRRDLGRGAGGVRTLRRPLQRRPAAQPVRQRRGEDLPPGAAGAAGSTRGHREEPGAKAQAVAPPLDTWLYVVKPDIDGKQEGMPSGRVDDASAVDDDRADPGNALEVVVAGQHRRAVARRGGGDPDVVGGDRRPRLAQLGDYLRVLTTRLGVDG